MQLNLRGSKPLGSGLHELRKGKCEFFIPFSQADGPLSLMCW